jgi:hypothetical protein
MTPAIFIARVVGTADKLIAGVMESMKIREQYEIAGVNDTGDNLNSVSFSPVNNDKHRVAHVSANFHKNSKRPQ